MTIPYVCVRDTVLFPKTTVNIYVDRKASLQALILSEAEYDKQLVLITQKRTEQDKPEAKSDLYSMGTLCRIAGLVRLQDGSMQVGFEGIKKFKIKTIDFAKTGLVTGEVIPPVSKKPKTLNIPTRIKLIELFVRAKPFVVFDEDLFWLKEWASLKTESQMADALQARLKYTNPFGPQTTPWERKASKEVKLINKRIFLMQMILEAPHSADRLLKIKSYLLNEIETSSSQI